MHFCWFRNGLILFVVILFQIKDVVSKMNILSTSIYKFEWAKTLRLFELVAVCFTIQFFPLQILIRLMSKYLSVSKSPHSICIIVVSIHVCFVFAFRIGEPRIVFELIVKLDKLFRQNEHAREKRPYFCTN